MQSVSASAPDELSDSAKTTAAASVSSFVSLLRSTDQSGLRAVLNIVGALSSSSLLELAATGASEARLRRLLVSGAGAPYELRGTTGGGEHSSQRRLMDKLEVQRARRLEVASTAQNLSTTTFGVVDSVSTTILDGAVAGGNTTVINVGDELAADKCAPPPLSRPAHPLLPTSPRHNPNSLTLVIPSSHCTPWASLAIVRVPAEHSRPNVACFTSQNNFLSLAVFKVANDTEESGADISATLSVAFNASALGNSSSSGALGVSTVAWTTNPYLYADGTPSLQSPVTSLSVGVEVTAATVPIVLTMRISALTPLEEFRCSFWDATVGNWSDRGTVVLGFTTAPDGAAVGVCGTMHLTDFSSVQKQTGGWCQDLHVASSLPPPAAAGSLGWRLVATVAFSQWPRGPFRPGSPRTPPPPAPLSSSFLRGALLPSLPCPRIPGRDRYRPYWRCGSAAEAV